MSGPTSRRVMFVSGGSRGIGAGIVLSAAAAGYDVAFTYKDSQSAAHEVLAAAATASPEARCRMYRLDVRDSTDVERVGDEVLADFETVHVVVANAAITHGGLAFSTSDEDWKNVLDTNLTGAFYVARQFLPALLANGFGRYIFISSIGARGMAGDVAYSASKAGMLGLSAALAKEYGRKGITSNALILGLFDTAMSAHEGMAAKRQIHAQHSPVGRMGDIAEIGAAIQFLSSDAAGFINGQEIGLTGGLDWAL
jgi:NAD(P)-dependent dehydrogenase (short-subunit alcohol dehydrogenase family)